MFKEERHQLRPGGAAYLLTQRPNRRSPRYSCDITVTNIWIVDLFGAIGASDILDACDVQVLQLDQHRAEP